jgi:phage shock protein B
MDGIVVAFFVPTVIFLTIVAPVWIFMHYRSKQRAQGSLSAEERLELEVLAAEAQRMAQRIETLEAILEAETPGWRERISAEH